MVELSASSPEAALKIARAGLEHVHHAFEFHRGGSSVPFDQAMSSDTPALFHTAEESGSGTLEAPSLSVPYINGTLSGPALRGKLNQWARFGTIEPSAADAIRAVSETPEWLDLRGKVFVLLGAGSAMGPLPLLLSLGATIVAVDLDRAPIWSRIVSMARASPGKLVFPVKQPRAELATDDALFAAAGCNLFTHTPEILAWLAGVLPGEPLVVGQYAYLDGARHVQVALAMDAIAAGLVKRREKGSVTIASLCTPTDAFSVPRDAYAVALERFNTAPSFDKALAAMSGGRWCVKSARRPVPLADVDGGGGAEAYVVDNIALAQGPNYTLAKRIQIWRAMVAREDDGCAVSANVAPATATQSVVHARSFAWVYSGLPHFEPLEIFQQETSNAVMGALLVYDVMSPESVARPSARKLSNPLELFQLNAFHGGVWRMAFSMESIGEPAALVHWARVLRPIILLLLIAFAAAAYLLSTRTSPKPTS